MSHTTGRSEHMSRASRTLARTFGFERFREGQQEALAALLGDEESADGHGRGSALAVFPTGAGKSLLYQLPAVVLNEAGEGTALVVSPLISLMEDQIAFLRSRGVRAGRLDSSLSAEETREVETALREGSLAILYVSPERFNNERFLSLLESVGGPGEGGISLFAVDEAHCISEWGHNFRPDYLKLAGVADRLRVPRVLALTATATREVAADVACQFRIPEDNVVRTGFYRPNLALLTTKVAAGERERLLGERLRSPKRTPGPTIVYTTLQRTAERVAAVLAEAGFDAAAYHAGMDPAERQRVQSEWSASSRKIVVATIAFGMGIDKADVRYVYHYNLSKSLESFAQEIGRAGRDGRHSVVESFFCAEDLPTLENFAYGDTPHPPAVQAMTREILGKDSEPESGREFSVAVRDLSVRHDIRGLVVKTILTYMELDGLIRQGTPFYAAYKVRLWSGADAAALSGREEPLRTILERAAEAGASRWATVEIEDLCEQFGVSRREAVRALDGAREAGLLEVKTEGARLSFTRLAAAREADSEAVAGTIMQRLRRRERQEIERLYQMAGLLSHQGCQWAALCARFGGGLAEGCGHCTYCARGRAVAPLRAPAFDAGQERVLRAIEEVTRYRVEYPPALGEDRQAARFLCGLSSPATTSAKLSRDALFGELSDVPFETVLEALGADSARVGPSLSIELVPRTCWFANVRSEVSGADWERLKRATFKSAGYRCEVCGGRGEKWPVECHEIWDYDDELGLQTLRGLIALCPACHEVKHIGRAEMHGRGEAARDHLARVNGWSTEEAEGYIEERFGLWYIRSERDWELEVSWLYENFGIEAGQRSPEDTGRP